MIVVRKYARERKDKVIEYAQAKIELWIIWNLLYNAGSSFAEAAKMRHQASHLCIRLKTLKYAVEISATHLNSSHTFPYKSHLATDAYFDLVCRVAEHD